MALLKTRGGLILSSELESQDLSSLVVVRDKSDLAGDLDSTKLYLLDGVIDMGSTQITVPQGGLTIHGLDLGISGLTTSENSHTLFIDDGVFSGDLFLRDMFVTVSGTGSQVFDLDNDGNNNAVECTDFNFVGCTSLGVLDSYRQGLWANFAIIACDDGLTMEGTWAGGFASLTCILVSAGTPFTGTVFKKGTSLVINGSFRSDFNALQLDDAGGFCDFEPSNITNSAQFKITGLRVNPDSNSFPNMPESSVKAVFSNCLGTSNTHIGGQWTITSEATTTITTVNTPVKMAGTTTYSDLQHFTGSVDNAFTYIGDDDIGINVDCDISLSGGNNDQVSVVLRQWDNSASSYINLATSSVETMNSAGRSGGISVHGFGEFSTNDRFEVWVQNETDTDNITGKLNGLVSINQRPS